MCHYNVQCYTLYCIVHCSVQLEYIVQYMIVNFIALCNVIDCGSKLYSTILHIAMYCTPTCIVFCSIVQVLDAKDTKDTHTTV